MTNGPSDICVNVDSDEVQVIGNLFRDESRSQTRTIQDPRYETNGNEMPKIMLSDGGYQMRDTWRPHASVVVNT